jgi:predicted HicB family RNase H-like nuclease
MNDTNSKPEVKALRVELDKSLHRQAKIKAATTGIPMAVICREALQAWIDEPTITIEEQG